MRGWRVLACDLFLDSDTVALAADTERAPGALDAGLDGSALPATLRALAARNGAMGAKLVTGSGFETQPRLLDDLAQDFLLLGNSGHTMAALKEPIRLVEALSQLGIPHPETRNVRPPDMNGWLEKRQGAAGGSHVRPASLAKTHGNAGYFQRQISGRSVSLLFAAGHAGFATIGFSEQWADSTPDMPFRFGGAAQPARLSHDVRRRLTHWVKRVAEHFGLRGVNSADFIIDDSDAWLIEINPRFGATLDLFADSDPDPIAAHLAAFNEPLSTARALGCQATALQIRYAETLITIPDSIQWPHWISDRPRPGTSIKPGEPVFTIRASADTIEAAIELLSRRMVDARNLFC